MHEQIFAGTTANASRAGCVAHANIVLKGPYAIRNGPFALVHGFAVIDQERICLTN